METIYTHTRWKRFACNLFLMLALVAGNYASAQMCATPEPDAFAMMNGSLDEDLSKMGDITGKCINVKFHIVRSTDNSIGAYDPTNINTVLNFLNSEYNRHNIFFNNVGVNIINVTNFLELDNEQEGRSLVQQAGNDSNALNYYIVNRLWTNSQGNRFIGQALDIPSKNIIVRAASVENFVVTHEIGHAFGLIHTNFRENCVENIARNNCETCGDLLCDTEADPGRNVTSAYSTDLNNYMRSSDFANVGLTRFSQGQIRRMHNFIENDSRLAGITSSTCVIPQLTAIDNLCNGIDKGVSVINLGSNSVTWQVSSNILIQGFSGNMITIVPQNSLTTGEGWVEATIAPTGQKLRRTFYIGIPEFNRLNMVSSGNFTLQQNNLYQLTATMSPYNQVADKNLNYEWNIPYAQLRSGNMGRVITVQPTQTGTYPYTLRAKNECGCTSWLTRFFEVSSAPQGGFFIQPN